MQLQENKNQEQEQKKSKLDFIESELETIRSLTRTVKLRYVQSCGCGTEAIEIERVVDMDSPLKDGHTVYQLLPTDKTI